MRLGKNFLIFFFAFTLIAGVRYRVLVLESDYRDLSGFQYHLIQFLDADAFKYDVLSPSERLEYSQLVDASGNLRYSTVIIFRRASELSSGEKDALKLASSRGISLISFIDVVEDASFYKDLFSIQSVGEWESAGNIRIKNHHGFLTHEITGEKLKETNIRYIEVKSTCTVLAASGENVPVIVACPYSKGVNYLFNLDKDSLGWWWTEWKNSAKDPRLVLLRRAIIENSGLGFIYYDLSHTLIMRIDDLLQHRHIWEEPLYQDLYPIVTRRLSEEDLKNIGDVYQKHKAYVTFLVVPGLVDPGPSKGILLLNGNSPSVRGCGMVFDVKDVVFRVTSGWNAGSVYDYPDEYKGLIELQKRGIIDIEEHGYTHLNWKRNEWCASPDKSTNPYKWEREFVDMADHQPVPREVQQDIIYQGYIRIKRWFGHEPVALIPPGHAHDETTLELSHEFGIKLFSVGWLGIWKDWGYDKNEQIKSLFINYLYWDPPAELKWHIAAGPMLVYYHDWDLILGGPDWLDKFLSQWEETLDVRRIISLREFAGYYFSQLEGQRQGNEFSISVDLTGTGGPHDLPDDRFFSDHTLVVKIHLPEGRWRTINYFRGFTGVQTSSSDVEKMYFDQGELIVEFKPFGKTSKKTAIVKFFEGKR